ncbi:MAG: hypothetical protein IJ362_07475, partial [Oscillospiraceae bacterium]|nr:hypothetical protein [Oscillospiraceae bacterium]
MRKKLSRILALILAVSISLNSLPMAAFATNSEPTVPEIEITETVDDTKEDPTDPIDDSTEDPVVDPA